MRLLSPIRRTDKYEEPESIVTQWSIFGLLVSHVRMRVGGHMLSVYWGQPRVD